VRVPVGAKSLRRDSGAWFAPAQWTALGLPAPVRKLLAA
jgi:hypothetical protein